MLLLFGIKVTAQNYGRITVIPSKAIVQGLRGENLLQVSVVDSLTNEPLNGASILLKNWKDSISCSWDYNLPFMNIKNIIDSVYIEVRYMGYNTLRANIYIDQLSMVKVELSQKHVDIAKIMVKGKIMSMEFKGDTVQFNAAAVKTFNGSTMSELLSLMAGMTVTNNVLIFNGKPIKYLYIDKEKLFGDNIRAAIHNITADDVINVQVYEEIEEFDVLNNVKHPRKVTVANVNTRSKKQYISNKELKLSPYRYYTGESAKVFSSSANFNVLKTMTGKTLELRNNGSIYPHDYNGVDIAEVHANFQRRKPGDFDFKTQNDINFNNRRNESNILRSYLDNELMPWSNLNTDNYSKMNAWSFRSFNDLSKYFEDESELVTSVELKAKFRKNDYNHDQMMYDASSNLVNGNRQIQTSRDNSFDMNSVINYNKYIENIDMEMRNLVMIGWVEGNGHSDKRDSIYLEGSNLVVQSKDINSQKSISESLSMSKSIFRNLSADFGAGASVQNQGRNYRYMDLNTMTLDTTQTKHFNSTEYSANLSFGLTAHGKSWRLSCGVGGVIDRERRKELFPLTEKVERNLDNTTFRASFIRDFGRLSSLNISYSRSNKTFPVDEFVNNNNKMSTTIDVLRNNIVEVSPFSLIIGEPSLRNPIDNTLGAKYSFVSPKMGVFNMSIEAKLIENYVGHKREYFTEKTYLEQYDYFVNSGATLTKYMNVGEMKGFKVEFEYSKMVDAIHSTFRLNGLYSINKVPLMEGEKITKNNTDNWAMWANYSSAFSKKITITALYRIDVTTISNLMNARRSVINTCSADCRIQLTKHISSYLTDEWYCQRVDGEANNLSKNVTHLIFYWRNNKLTISFSINDIFAQGKSSSISYFDNFMEVTNNSILGRSLGVSFRWKW